MPDPPPLLRVRVDHHVYQHVTDGPSLVQLLSELEARLMSAISDRIARLTTAVDGAIARVQSDVSSLNTEIQRLQDLVEEGTATQQDMDALDALQAKLDALDPVKPATLPDTGPTPA
jgi:multidrug resistance efflux pump